MPWLIEAYLDEAETATGYRSSLRKDSGVHNPNGEYIHIQNSGKKFNISERPSRAAAKSGILTKDDKNNVGGYNRTKKEYSNELLRYHTDPENPKIPDGKTKVPNLALQSPESIVRYANKHSVSNETKDREKYKEAVKWAEKQLKPGMLKKADPEAVAQAADAKARHDRRHPEAKHECADIVEIFQ